MEDKKKEELMEEEIDLDDLEQVTGGSELRRTKKEKTQDISQDTINRMNQ